MFYKSWFMFKYKVQLLAEQQLISLIYICPGKLYVDIYHV